MSEQRRGTLTLALVAATGTCAALNVWWRGPFFGLLPFLLYTVAPVVLLAWPLTRLRVNQRVTIAVAFLAAVASSYVLCAPPTTGFLFRFYLGCEQVPDVHELQRWNDNWARDPSVHLRFYARPEVVQTLAARAHLREEELRPLPFAPEPLRTPRAWLPVPDWWAPEAIPSPRRGKGFADDVGRSLWYEETTGLTYVSIRVP